MKDNFSRQSDLYAKYRPDYPAELFDHILRFVKEKELAWDCGTGNGQSAVPLSERFTKVYATDISRKQLAHAAQNLRIEYVLEPAEQTSLSDHSVDLITVAQAIHWFKFDAFYSEVRRVAKPGAVIAVWAYSLLRISGSIDSILDNYHNNTLGPYWDPERKYVDDGYASIPFPFVPLETPSFSIERNWSLKDLAGYLNTWSALQKYQAVHSENPVPGIIAAVSGYWGAEEKRKVIFPVHLRLGFVE
ncbi:MAG: class I SAM-dependent methyltransferase [Ferruginibacter sp.]